MPNAVHSERVHFERRCPFRHRLKPAVKTKNLLKQVKVDAINVLQHVFSNSLGMHPQTLFCQILQHPQHG